MSRSRELAELIGNAGGTSEQVLSGRRNLIINGDFQVNQRGDYSTATSLNNGAYTLDRWTCTNGVGATIQHRQDMPSGEYGKSVKVLTSSGGTAQCAIEQRIEVADWMYGKVITASAWVRSNSANASINIYNNTDGFWTAVSHSGNGTWEKLTITGTLPTSMTDFRVRIGLSQGGNTTIVSGDYFEIANVQLELGSVATPFEHRSYGEELALCQRYYELLKCYTAEANTYYGSWIYMDGVNFRTVKRVSPSVTVTGLYGWPSGISASNLVADTVNDQLVGVTDRNSANNLFSYEVAADAEL